MFSVDHPGAPLDPALVLAYGSIRTATIGHHLDDGFVGAEITGIRRRQRAVGRVVTVRTRGADWTAAQFAVSTLVPGDVLVMDMAGERTHSCWGVGMTVAAAARGAAAAVIDGPVNDVSDIEDEDFAVWCRGATAKTARGLVLGGEINGPISCGAATVRPGDLVVADDDGVVVVDPEVAARWLPVFEARQQRVAERLLRLREGARLSPYADADELRAATAGGQ